MGFVDSLGPYERGVPYDELEGLRADRGVYVDVAGAREVRAAVHRALGNALVHSAVVGATHWDRAGFGTGDPDLPGPASAFFFTPDRIRVWVGDWGRDGFEARVHDAHRAFVEWTGGWLGVDHHRGLDACLGAYVGVVDG